LRGGSWNNNSNNLRSSYRDWYAPGERHNLLGFRVVASASTLRYQRRRKGLRRECLKSPVRIPVTEAIPSENKKGSGSLVGCKSRTVARTIFNGRFTDYSKDLRFD
jgi:hypothetical protein